VIYQGAVEKGLSDIAEENSDSVELFIGRPGGILPENSGSLRKAAMRVFSFLSVDQVASGMTNLLLDGSQKPILEWTDLDQIA
jgi:hypothetical protein